jgi:threonine/homoserine/homoserine lactone efflux protein
VAFVILKVVGAIVLVFMGIRSWRHAWRVRGVVTDPHIGIDARGDRGKWRAFGEGLVVQLANPKAAVFMIAFYPQFVPADRNLFTTTAALAVIQVVIETVLYLGLAAGVGRARGWFSRSTVRRRLEYVSGTVLVALGLRVATTSQ